MCAKKQCSTRFSLIKNYLKKTQEPKKTWKQEHWKKSFRKTGARKNGHIFKTIQMCCLFFPFLLPCKQRKSSQDGQRRERKKNRKPCAPITMLPQILTKASVFSSRRKKGLVSKILAQQALTNLSTALLCQETSSKERPRLTEETNVGYDTSCVCTCMCQGGERQMS